MSRRRIIWPALLITPALAITTAMAGASTGMLSASAAGASSCGLSHAAFCDTFATFTPMAQQGREGDQNPRKWSFSRVTSDVSPYPLDTSNTYHPARADFCGQPVHVQPEWDSFICSTVTPNMPGTWGTVINDFGSYDASIRLPDGTHPGTQGAYVASGSRIRQPFDFAGRTGTVTFKVDAQLDGSGNDRPHGAWPEVWLTDQPVQIPHLTYPGTHVYPQNGINFTFNDCPGAPPADNANSITKIAVFNNYIETDLALPSPPDCFQTQTDNPNQFQLKISQSHVAVLASDAGGANLRMVASVPVSLDFTRGYLSFEHASYNAGKFGASNTSSFHWQAIGFDGPVLAVDRGYEVPDALHVNNASDQASGSNNAIGSVNLGYQVGKVGCNTAGCATPTFGLHGVNPANAAAAYLTYTIWFDGAPHQMTATVNGVPFTYVDPNPDGAGPTCVSGCPVAWRSMVQPIPVSALHPGLNTVSFSDPGTLTQNATIANIDLEIVPGGTPSSTTTTVPPTTTTVPPTTTTTPVSPTTTTTTVPPTTTTTTVPATTTTSTAPGGDLWASISPPQVSTNFNSPQNNYGFNSVVLDPSNPHVLFMGTNYQGLWRSVDQGGTWTKINTGAGGGLLDQGRLWTLAIDPFDHNTLWTTSGYGAGGPLKSTDGGVSWALLPVGAPSQYNDVYSINVDPYTPNHVLVAWHSPWSTDGVSSGVTESADGGATWTNHPAPAGSNWGAGNAAWFLDTSHTWLLGSQNGGIWRTSNSAASWTLVRNQNITHGGINALVRDPATGTLSIATQVSIGISTDDGRTWTDPPGLSYNYYETVVSDGTNLYTAPSYPVAQYVDGPWYYLPLTGGTRWKPYSTQHTCSKGNCNGLVMGAYDAVNHIAYAVNWLGGVWKHPGAGS